VTGPSKSTFSHRYSAIDRFSALIDGPREGINTVGSERKGGCISEVSEMQNVEKMQAG
jgi:hypothetical protein